MAKPLSGRAGSFALPVDGGAFCRYFSVVANCNAGGTLLHKVHLAPACRYSEDIDLVVFGERSEDHIRKAIRRVLAEVVGEPERSVWEDIKLAVRNAVKPSRVLRMTYAVPSVIEPGSHLGIVVEANVTERKPYRDIVRMPFSFFLLRVASYCFLIRYSFLIQSPSN
jgi:hypothetical protein